jgi:hypothetical protein
VYTIIEKSWDAKTPQDEKRHSTQLPLHTQPIGNARIQGKPRQKKKVDTHHNPNFIAFCHNLGI